MPLVSSYSLLSSFVQAHLYSLEFGDSNNILGTPIQSLSIPPLEIKDSIDFNKILDFYTLWLPLFSTPYYSSRI